MKTENIKMYIYIYKKKVFLLNIFVETMIFDLMNMINISLKSDEYKV